MFWNLRSWERVSKRSLMSALHTIMRPLQMANESTNTPFTSKLTGIWLAEDGEMDATSSAGNKSMALVKRTLNMDYILE